MCIKSGKQRGGGGGGEGGGGGQNPPSPKEAPSMQTSINGFARRIQKPQPYVNLK